MNGTMQVLTADRRLLMIETVDVEKSKSLLPDYYVEASNGVMVPRCDIAQYERGERSIREVVNLN